MKTHLVSESEPSEREERGGGSQLDVVIDATAYPVESKPTSQGEDCGVWLCRLVGFKNGTAQIEIPGRPSVLAAHAVACPLEFADIGSMLAVIFECQMLERPIVLGKIHSDFSLMSDTPADVSVSAETELTLRCGKASISMKADGTVAIRGSNVISRASHTNRIRGGNVQIN